jgi:protein-tyrosine phosphatase
MVTRVRVLRLTSVAVVDLHSHILPGLDDGADDIEVSLAMARTAAGDGVQAMAATPHVNFDYEVDPETMRAGVDELNAALADAGIALTVLPGGEISMPRAADLDDDELASFSLGGGRTLLIESPYLKGVASMEELLFDLQLRGFRVLLAHPERCPIFQDDPDRLRRIVARDVYCSVNTGSLAGIFGRRVRALAMDLLRGGLVHSIASDAHDDAGRPPGLLMGVRAAEQELPGVSAQADWYTRDAPAAFVEGTPLPARPPAPEPPAPSRLRRMLGRR